MAFSISELDLAINNALVMIAPQTEGAADPTASGGAWVQNGGSTGWDHPSISILHGGRVAIPAGATDFTAYTHLYLESAYRDTGAFPRMETTANGGLRVVLVDSLGNYARYNFHGNEFTNRTEGVGWRDFTSLGGIRAPNVYIDLTRTPDAESATAPDFTDIVALELHCAPIAASDFDFGFGNISLLTLPVATGGGVGSEIGFLEFQSAWASINNAPYRAWRLLEGDHSGIQGNVWSVWVGGSIGDGTTTTNFLEDSGTLAFFPSRGSFRPAGPWILLDDSYNRDLVINQSASDTFQLSNYLLTGTDDTPPNYSIRIQGSSSASAIFDTCNFLAMKELVLAHGSLVDCVFDGCSQITVDTNSSATRSTIRNTYTGGQGLRVAGDVGDYSALDLVIEDSIAIAAGAAGTYNLTGLSTLAASVNIEYEGSNAITVQLDPSITATWSSAGGGTVTIENQVVVDVTVTVRDQNSKALIDGAVVYLEADAGGSIAAGTVILNQTTTASGIATTSLSVSGDQPVIGRVRKASSSPFYTNFPLSGTITSSGFATTALMIRED